MLARRRLSLFSIGNAFLTFSGKVEKIEPLGLGPFNDGLVMLCIALVKQPIPIEQGFETGPPHNASWNKRVLYVLLSRHRLQPTSSSSSAPPPPFIRYLKPSSSTFYEASISSRTGSRGRSRVSRRQETPAHLSITKPFTTTQMW